MFPPSAGAAEPAPMIAPMCNTPPVPITYSTATPIAASTRIAIRIGTTRLLLRTMAISSIASPSLMAGHSPALDDDFFLHHRDPNLLAWPYGFERATEILLRQAVTVVNGAPDG